MLVLQNISYIHPNKDLRLDNINLTVNSQDKVALVGNNGSGKSTLLKLIAGELQAAGGKVSMETPPYYVPQLLGQYNHLTVAQALRIEHKINALKEILSENATEENYALLDDDWTIEDRCLKALAYWKLGDLDLSQKLETLSGGQKTSVFLAGISIHEPGLILLDEPSNHLDLARRARLYEFIQSTQSTLLVVSHDRKLLNLLSTVCELSKRGITVYGGNFDFYSTQKQLENDALNQDLQSKEKALRRAKEKEKETLERQQKSDSRGKGKQKKSGLARIMMNTLRNQAENSTSKIKSVHAEKIDRISEELKELRTLVPDVGKMKFGLEDAALHKGKILFTADNVNFAFGTQPLWKPNLTIQIKSGERIALKGKNGAGKTTLLRLILGRIEPQVGTVFRRENKSVYIDQDYSLIDNKLSVYEQAQRFNTSALLEHEIKIRLNRFLFPKEDWDKPCRALSGGEKMRLMLCCLTIQHQSPDMIILDEPTNNLDLENIEILTRAVNDFHGTCIVVSHDETFLEQANIERTIQL